MEISSSTVWPPIAAPAVLFIRYGDFLIEKCETHPKLFVISFKKS